MTLIVYVQAQLYPHSVTNQILCRLANCNTIMVFTCRYHLEYIVVRFVVQCTCVREIASVHCEEKRSNADSISCLFA